MNSLRRVAGLWNWLPAFRAVAETEHLPTAARAIGVSAPGLSRAVKLVEAELGQPLFERTARRLRLNDAGRQFLVHVRDAMRRVDDGLQALSDETFRGTLRVSASLSVGQAFALPAIAQLRQEHPALVVELVHADEAQVAESLRQGALDVAFLEHISVPPELAVKRLGSTTYGIYCGRSHGLAGSRRLTLEECLQHPFVGPSEGGDDAWPVELRREVALRVQALALAVSACEHGAYLALLPDDAAQDRGDRLRRLPVGTVAETPVYLAYRSPLGVRDRVAVFLETLQVVHPLKNNIPT